MADIVSGPHPSGRTVTRFMLALSVLCLFVAAGCIVAGSRAEALVFGAGWVVTCALWEWDRAGSSHEPNRP